MGGSFLEVLILFEHEQLHDGMAETLEDDFDMRGCQRSRQQHDGAPHCRTPALSMWRIDPCWRTQLLVERSQDLGACMILGWP